MAKLKTPLWAIFGPYWREVRHHPLLLAAAFVGAILLQAANLITPIYLRRLINLLVGNHPDPSTVHALLATLWVIVAMWFMDWVAKRLQGFSVTNLESRIMSKLQSEAFEYLLGHSNNFFVSNFAGSLTHKVKQYARAFEIIVDSVIFQFFPMLLFIIGAVGVLFTHNRLLGLALGIWAAVFITFQIYVSRLRQPLRVEQAAADSQVTATLADAISNQTTISLFSAKDFEKQAFQNTVEDWRRKTIHLWNADEYIWMGIGLFIIVIQGVMMFGAVYFWQRNELTAGDFVLIQAYLITTFGQLIGINRELRRFYSALAEAGEMAEILGQPHEVPDAPDAQVLRVSDARIDFKNVEFYFHPARSVLQGFNLSIARGEKVALVGPSGAGKSTIIKLLLRFFDVKDGAIKIDGLNIANATQESLRNAIAFVPQEPILFHRTLMENIRYGRRAASDEEVVAAAKQAHCHEFISDLPLGYHTHVGERGVKLSGGERQRVAIARAILKNAPILVLDEATSSLDSESEALIQDALATLMRGKTVIVIAHRLSTIMKIDRIIVLEQGHIVADGTHQALLGQGGLYHKL